LETGTSCLVRCVACAVDNGHNFRTRLLDADLRIRLRWLPAALRTGGDVGYPEHYLPALPKLAPHAATFRLPRREIDQRLRFVSRSIGRRFFLLRLLRWRLLHAGRLRLPLGAIRALSRAVAGTAVKPGPGYQSPSSATFSRTTFCVSRIPRERRSRKIAERCSGGIASGGNTPADSRGKCFTNRAASWAVA